MTAKAHDKITAGLSDALAGRTFGDEARIVDVARDVLAAMDGR